MKISNFKIIPILIGLLLCQVQACKSSKKKGWYVKINKVEYEEKIKELEEAKAKEKELSQKLLEEREQNPISPVIQEEEKVLYYKKRKRGKGNMREVEVQREREGEERPSKRTNKRKDPEVARQETSRTEAGANTPVSVKIQRLESKSKEGDSREVS